MNAFFASIALLSTYAAPNLIENTLFDIPYLDLAGDTSRQVIVDQRENRYLGHTSTLLLEDGQTILCAYHLGHGSYPMVLKRSTDGGKTWSERISVPKDWKEPRRCPSLFRVTGPDEVERIILMEHHNGPMEQAVSVDGGLTWSSFEPNGLHGVVAPSTLVRRSDGRLLALHHRNLTGERGDPLTIWRNFSDDGGLTWHGAHQVAAVDGANPCEPAVIRSPDGKRLACVMRENLRKRNSLVMFSDDEGDTWSEPRELPAALTGDRHIARYVKDGRLVIVFRDMALGTPTEGDFVAWVGRFDDLTNNSAGQYRVRLLDNRGRPGECGYGGLELLPDGTLVGTTYCEMEENANPIIVSVRFTLAELDAVGLRAPFVIAERGIEP